MKKILMLGIFALIFVIAVPFPAGAVVLSAEITSPSENQVVSGTLLLAATYTGDPSDPVYWAVRENTCDAVSSTIVLGNVDGYSDSYTWQNGEFSASFDVSDFETGTYCFAFNPNGNNNDVRETAEFTIVMVDKVAPATPTNLKRYAPDEGKYYKCGDVSKIQRMWPEWDENTEEDFSHYEYSSFNAPYGNIGVNEMILTEPYYHYTGTWLPGEGTYGFAVRAVDKAGNKSAWAIGGTETFADSCKITYDSTAPQTITEMTIWQNGVEVGCGATVDERAIKVDWENSSDPNFSHFQYQADDGIEPIDFTTTLKLSERSGDIRDKDGTYYYRVRALDLAGNVGLWSEWCSITLDRDQDDDGVLDEDDLCSGVVIDVPTELLGVNRHIWDETDGPYFKTLVPAKKGQFDSARSEFSIVDTHGCSCEQILDKMSEKLGEEFGGHYKYGCSKSIIEDWISGEYYVGPTLIETVEVPANRSISTASTNILESEKDYFLKAYGAADAGDTILFDARYSLTERIIGDTWTDDVSGYLSYGPELLDLFVDGATVDWGEFNTEHEYTIPYAGTGSSASFLINDIYYSNNSGELFVDIIEDKWVSLW